MKKILLMCLAMLCACQSPDGKQLDDNPCGPEKLPVMEAYCEGASPNGGPCKIAPKEFAGACAIGCVLDVCGRDVTCKEEPAACDGRCDDLRSPVFWAHVTRARIDCRDQTRVTNPPSLSCIVAATEKVCPALVGQRWGDRIPDLAAPL
jgi:hypothetical protein